MTKEPGEWQVLKLKWDAVCVKCNRHIPVGTQVKWRKGVHRNVVIHENECPKSRKMRRRSPRIVSGGLPTLGRRR